MSNFLFPSEQQSYLQICAEPKVLAFLFKFRRNFIYFLEVVSSVNIQIEIIIMMLTDWLKEMLMTDWLTDWNTNEDGEYNWFWHTLSPLSCNGRIIENGKSYFEHLLWIIGIAMNLLVWNLGRKSERHKKRERILCFRWSEI